MHGLAVGGDRGPYDLAVFVLEHLGLTHGRRAPIHSDPEGLFDVRDGECHVVDTVAMLLHVLGDGAVGSQRSREHEPDIALLDAPRHVVPGAGLESSVSDWGETERAIELRGLLRVADEEMNVIDAE